ASRLLPHRANRVGARSALAQIGKTVQHPGGLLVGGATRSRCASPPPSSSRARDASRASCGGRVASRRSAPNTLRGGKRARGARHGAMDGRVRRRFPCDDDWRQLPAESPFYLIFGVEDRTISLPSAIRWEALRDAKERWPLPPTTRPSCTARNSRRCSERSWHARCGSAGGREAVTPGSRRTTAWHQMARQHVTRRAKRHGSTPRYRNPQDQEVGNEAHDDGSYSPSCNAPGMLVPQVSPAAPPARADGGAGRRSPEWEDRRGDRDRHCDGA